ncbi:MAG TPA: hypothetical protein VK934_12360 [Fimbriimonas sp.]|nr:hypothetical protein [Fimbriimonas sp.]
MNLNLWLDHSSNFAEGSVKALLAFGGPLLAARIAGFLRARSEERAYFGWWLFGAGFLLMVISGGICFVGLDLIDDVFSSPREEDFGLELMLISLLLFGAAVFLVVMSWLRFDSRRSSRDQFEAGAVHEPERFPTDLSERNVELMPHGVPGPNRHEIDLMAITDEA